ncbi:hypothetical protein [Chryseobacterium oncorhynchi]|uniref:Uncharacterized protein n=1 Tax=Chryseobacterium oncorhynchi TaxID=741074 RepID=A0A316X725_9FLAO|nr:hypothetical protein [Chryseobacterium oncorhynchi]PWN67098.1 hypothetical protein C1638_000325 [Chryseobacterium oncorhynchi]
MKKNLIYGLILLSTASFTLNSCRTDEMLTEAEQVQKEKIAFFERFEKEKSLSKNSSSNNYAIPFRNSMLAYFNNYPEKKIALESKYGTVDLRVSSQDLDLDSGKKLLMFPMLTNGKVTAVIGGVINGERDFLYFDAYKESHPDHDYLIKTFQEHYTSLSISKVTDVGEVVIIVKKPQLAKPDPWDDLGGNGGHDMGGGNGDYGGDGGGGGIGTPTAPVFPPLPPDIPIKDIKKFLSCLDTSKPANLTVYAAKMFSSSKPGHAFISITQGNNTMTFGFYPENGFPLTVTGPGQMGDDSGHTYNNAWNVGNITPAQLQNIINAAGTYSNSIYDVGFNNCVDFTVAILNYAGINFTAIGVDTPTTFANSIQSSTTSTNGTAPQTKRNCN